MAEFTIEQIRVFVAVVDHGGFAAAGRELGRAQSAITYSIRALEDATGLLLFDRAGYRPALTDAGRSLLPRARRLLADVEDVQRQAGAFAQGVEASIGLTVNPFVPLPPVARALHELQGLHPSVQVRLRIETRFNPAQYLQGTAPQLALMTVHPATPLGTDYASRSWRTVDLVAVAAPSHPLAAHEAPIPPEATREHMQIVWTPTDAPSESPDTGVHSLDRWYVTDLQAKLALICEGVGWGSMPSHLVQDATHAGRLKRLDMKSWEGSDRMPGIPVSIVWRTEMHVRPATRSLMPLLNFEWVRSEPDEEAIEVVG